VTRLGRPDDQCGRDLGWIGVSHAAILPARVPRGYGRPWWWLAAVAWARGL
jgi:hypothetical protein